MLSNNILSKRILLTSKYQAGKRDTDKYLDVTISMKYKYYLRNKSFGHRCLLFENFLSFKK